MEDAGYAYKNLTGNTKGERLLERPRHRWEDNITRSYEKN
jgi:hypothetical protein